MTIRTMVEVERGKWTDSRTSGQYLFVIMDVQAVAELRTVFSKWA